MKKITREQLEELNKWLENFDLQRHNRKIFRDFSDGVLLAQILKQIYPKLVELHNYPPRNSTMLKFNNWETLNRKILKKLGLHQSTEFLKRVSQAVPGAAELLLYQIMQFIQEDQERRASSNEKNEQEENAEIMIVNVNRKIGDAIVQVPQKMILFSIYENAQEQICKQYNEIVSLRQKVTHLENFLKIKINRIEDLNRQLASQSLIRNNEDSISSNSIRKSSPCILN